MAILLVLAGATLQTSSAFEGEHIPAELHQLVENGGYAVKKNKVYFAASNLHTPYVPASIIKIATSLVALEVMGPSYRFETTFFLDPRNNLYIKGWGDPFLISEEVAVIVGKLKEHGCTEINDIYLDNSAFQLLEAAAGSGLSPNPYDAQNSALAVNFNTVKILIDTAGKVRSGEEQTPTLPLMKELSKGFAAGLYRINISRSDISGTAIISQYTGELFRAFQKQEGIAGDGAIISRKTPENLKPFYRHKSTKTLVDILGPLMLYSNNFIANQLFLSLGAARFGYPATWKKSRQVMADYFQKTYDFSGKEIRVVEGSGLSRKNRISPHAMIQLLDSFSPYAKILPRQEGKYLKSGTLKGVYSYAGYFIGKTGLDSFVLLMNQENNNRDRLLGALEELYRAP